MARPFKAAPAAALAATALSLGACGHNPYGIQASLGDRECMARVMYFESNRSSDEGMLAVGTVVMNRLQSSRYPKTICGVVAQQNQFADGALSKPVGGRSYAKALQVADAVIAGERHAAVGGAMFFHTAGYTYPYRNMAYVVAAGGNVFYEKKTPGTFERVHPTVLASQANDARLVGTKPIRVAATRTDDDGEDEAPRAPRARTARLAPPAARETPTRLRPTLTRVASAEDEDDDEAPAPRPPARRPSPEPDRRGSVVVASAAPPASRPREKASPPSIAELIEIDLDRPRRPR